VSRFVDRPIVCALSNEANTGPANSQRLYDLPPLAAREALIAARFADWIGERSLGTCDVLLRQLSKTAVRDDALGTVPSTLRTSARTYSVCCLVKDEAAITSGCC
jgi:hypothetical protein